MISEHENTDTMTKDDPIGAWETILIWLGGGALLLVTLVEAISVFGALISRSFLGSLEIVEALVLISGVVAILLMSMAGGHARVHLLLERLPPRPQFVLNLLALILSILFIVGCVFGSVLGWMAMRGSFEQSEVLHIAHAPLRLFLIGSLVLITLAFIVHLLQLVTGRGLQAQFEMSDAEKGEQS